MFFYLCKVLLSDFLQFNDNVVDNQNNSRYRDCSALSSVLDLSLLSDINKYNSIVIRKGVSEHTDWAISLQK